MNSDLSKMEVRECPFCGGTASSLIRKHGSMFEPCEHGATHHSCQNHACDLYRLTIRADQWNRRAAPRELVELVREYDRVAAMRDLTSDEAGAAEWELVNGVRKLCEVGDGNEN